jgi:hypothetical protein
MVNIDGRRQGFELARVVQRAFDFLQRLFDVRTMPADEECERAAVGGVAVFEFGDAAAIQHYGHSGCCVGYFDEHCAAPYAFAARCCSSRATSSRISASVFPAMRAALIAATSSAGHATARSESLTGRTKRPFLILK